MNQPREVEAVSRGTQTRDGAGVKLTRIFGHSEAEQLDPFLLLDFFGSENPDEYMAGFPWHPHRGIETITYMMNGRVRHEDSLGNGGVIGTGDVQWMTAGSGIIHQEMPELSEDSMTGFQLWANLPAKQKMMDPRYRDVTTEDIVEVEMDGVTIRIIAGKIGAKEGPVTDVVIEPEYLDIAMNKETTFVHTIDEGHTVFAYVFEGQVSFGNTRVEAGNLVIFGDGDGIEATSDTGARFLLVSGKPLNEPIAWYGPIVMNTREELDLALKEYRNGTFIKHEGQPVADKQGEIILICCPARRVVEFVLRTDERMRTRLFVEPKGRVREELTLFSCIPNTIEAYKKWKSCWIGNKEFKKWRKAKWHREVLGDLIPGKIISAKKFDNYEESSLKGPIIAYRSSILEAGSKRKLPMVVFGRIKKHLRVNDFEDMKLNEEEEKAISQDIKQDLWAPISVWHPPLVSRSKEVDPADLLEHAISYAKALLFEDFKNTSWNGFVETEQFK